MESMTFCPDCEEEVPASEFIKHREQKHPPALTAVAGAGGIRSQEAHGYQPSDDDQEE